MVFPLAFPLMKFLSMPVIAGLDRAIHAAFRRAALRFG
jgi:hypothetical protein